MDADQKSRLETLIETLHKRWGPTSLQTGQAFSPKAYERISTGFAPLDVFLGGGLNRGQIVELLGRPTSGVTTLTYKIMAQAQSTMEFGLYIDVEGTFDADYAARCGIASERLFLARPETDHQTLDVARDLLDSQSVGAVVLDLGDHYVRSDPLQRLTHTLRRSGGLVLLLRSVTSGRLSAQTLSSGAMQLCVERIAWLRRDDDIRGYRTRITQLMSPPVTSRHVLIDIDFDDSVAGEPL